MKMVGIKFCLYWINFALVVSQVFYWINGKIINSNTLLGSGSEWPEDNGSIFKRIN